MKLSNVVALVLAAAILGGCSSTEEFTQEAKSYTKTKAIYCGGSVVINYANLDGMIAISCGDGSSKVMFLDD